MSHPLRIIDANANRAREALRVMEDAARFILDHRELSESLKTLRHDFAAALLNIPGASAAVCWRDTPGDVGTGIATPAELTRIGSRAVVIAAAKRLTEALRSIEEYTKVLDPRAPGDGAPSGTPGPPASARFESLRYRAYDAERTLTLALGASREHFTGWRLCVILTESLCTHPWLDVARAAIGSGADCLQLREKTLDGAELLARARTLVSIARDVSSRPAVVINDRPDIALLSGADGVHLGQSDLPVAEARRIVGFDLLVGVSTENIPQARAALDQGADYCGVGPMFPTATKSKPRLAGLAYLRQYLEHEPELPPALAIGGITPANLPELLAAGLAPRSGSALPQRAGIAVSSAVCSAPNSAVACRRLIELLGAAPTGLPV